MPATPHEPSTPQAELIRSLAKAFADDERVAALCLAGSFASRTPDAHSDIDFVAVVAPEQREAFVETWLDELRRIAPLVLVQRPGEGLVHVITDSWLRCDLVVVGEDELTGRARTSLAPLIDRHGLHARLSQRGEPARPSPQRVRGLVNEFLRVLGLLPVVLGRNELAVGVSGAGVLRGHLISLLLEEAEVAERGGALHLNRLLAPERLALLENLPALACDRESIAQAHVAVSRAFFAVARPLAAKLGAEWPDAFEAATRRYLQRELGAAL